VLCLYQLSLDKLCQVHGVSYTSPFTGMDELSDSEHEVSALPQRIARTSDLSTRESIAY